jgi:hypothetical protein
VIDDELLVKTRTNICLSETSAVSSYSVSVCTPGWRHRMAYFHVSTRTKYRLSDTSDPVSILCFSCLMIYHDEIHFTTLHMADLGTRAESLGEGARAEKGEGKERQLKPLRRRGHATCTHCVPIFSLGHACINLSSAK